MTKRQVLLIGMIVLILLAFAVPVLAQRGGDDRDGDGLPDSIDGCPAEPGPRSNGGCPLSNPDSGGDTPDRDGDGVPDYVDLCPDQAGTGFTEGCPDNPADTNPDPDQPIILGSVPNPQQALFTWGSLSQCMVGLFPTAPTTVNIRQNATTSSGIIGQLLPGQQFAPVFVNYDDNGGRWFGGAPAGDDWGWVFGGVVANNGQCDNLAMLLHVDTPFQPDILLTFDLDAVPAGTTQVVNHLKQIAIADLSHPDADHHQQIDRSLIIYTGLEDSTIYLLFRLLDDLGNPPPGDAPFEPPTLVIVTTRSGQIISAGNPQNAPPTGVGSWITDSTYSPSDGVAIDTLLGRSITAHDGLQPNQTGADEIWDWREIVIASLAPWEISLQPVLFVTPSDPNAPDEHCADIGAGFCTQALVLLPALGDAPGQCPPEQFFNGLQAAFPNSDDIYQRAMRIVGAELDADGEIDDMAFNLVPPVAAGLLLPAVAKITEHTLQPTDPGLNLNFVGDGSVVPSDGIHLTEINDGTSNTLMNNDGTSNTMLLVETNDALLRDGTSNTMIYNEKYAEYASCSILAAVPGGDGGFGWHALILPQME